MQGFRLNRLPWGAVLILGVVGCSIAQPNPVNPDAAEPTTSTVRVPIFSFRNLNFGRVVGTVSASADLLKSAGVTGFEGAKAQAFDPDGTALSNKVTVDANGNFLIEGLKESRPRIFVEVSVATAEGTSLRFRSTMPAPRERKDYPVALDAGTTYLSDKLLRAALDHDVPLDKLDELKVDQTEQVVNIYLEDAKGREVLTKDPSLDTATKADLNAYAFDHFMEDYPPVKTAVYALSPAILRGWKPSKPVPSSSPTATPNPNATPSPSPTPRQTADPNAK